MDNKEIPNFEFDEEKIEFLLENTDKLVSVLTPDQINSLVDALKENLGKIEETIEKLKSSEESNDQ